MAIARVTIDISNLTRDGGIIDNDIERRSVRVESRARVLCPVDRGRLRATIAHSRGDRPLVWQVSADTVYAMWIHEGMRYDPRAGRIVYVHAGPRPFLVDALDAAV
jgi:hypothetical protein